MNEKYSVFVVDDNPVFLKDIRRLPIWGDSTGFELIGQAENGRDAIDILIRNPVDVLITDIRMPIVDGVELLKQVNEKSLSRFTIFCSEYKDFHYARNGIIHGVFDYLVKPVVVDDLYHLFSRIKKEIVAKNGIEYLLVLKAKEICDGIILGRIRDANDILRDEVTVNLMGDDPARILNYTVRFNIYLLKRLEEVFPWVNNYTDLDQVRKIHFSSEDSLKELKAKTSENIKSIVNFLNKYYYLDTHHKRIHEITNHIINSSVENLTLDRIAKEFYLNPSHLSAFFKVKTGKNIIDIIIQNKMEKAKKMLLDQSMRIYEISLKMGYKDQEYFSRQFKKYTGLSPKEFIQISELS